MKIAFYLGSFNPFHNGHLKVVKAALNDHNIDKVVIVPTMQNPWKEEKVLDIIKRRKIIENYISDFILNIPYDRYYGKFSPIKMDLIEKDLIPPYYSYNTLQALKEKYAGSELYFLCGEDTIKAISNWYNGNKILNEWKFIVVDRPKDDVSSSMIRGLIKEHKDITPYVPSNLAELIYSYYNVLTL